MKIGSTIMRTRIVLLIAALLLVPMVPSSTGQSVTPMIELECNDSLEFNQMINHSNHTAFCSIGNPTAYEETVQFSIMSNSSIIITDSPTNLSIDAGESINFTINMTLNHDPMDYNPLTESYSVFVEATVTHVNGVTNTQSTVRDAYIDFNPSNTLKMYRNGNSCWSSFGHTLQNGSVDFWQDEPHLEAYMMNGLLEVDIKCPLTPELFNAWILESNNTFEGEILIELGGHWTNGQEGCSGNNNGNCENLNISLLNGSNEIFRQEISNETDDGMNEVELEITSPSVPILFNDSNNLVIQFEMVIVGDYQEGGWFTGPTGEEALFRLYLGDNSTLTIPLVYEPDTDGDGIPDSYDPYPENTNNTDNETQGTPTVGLELGCNTTDGIIYTDGDNRTEIINCQLHNPSEHQEHVQFTLAAGGLGISGPGVLSVDSMETTDFEITILANRGIQGIYSISITATVSHVNGVANPTPITDSLTLLVELIANDTDGDGVTDDLDVFPEDANETHDSDGDGVGDNADQFPNDPDEDTDTDGDGVGDNSDHAPENPDIQLPESTKGGSTTTAIYVLAGAIGLLAIALLIGMRRKGGGPVHNVPVHHEDSLWDA